MRPSGVTDRIRELHELAQHHQDELDKDTAFYSVADLAARWHCSGNTACRERERQECNRIACADAWPRLPHGSAEGVVKPRSSWKQPKRSAPPQFDTPDVRAAIKSAAPEVERRWQAYLAAAMGDAFE